MENQIISIAKSKAEMVQRNSMLIVEVVNKFRDNHFKTKITEFYHMELQRFMSENGISSPLPIIYKLRKSGVLTNMGADFSKSGRPLLLGFQSIDKPIHYSKIVESLLYEIEDPKQLHSQRISQRFNGTIDFEKTEDIKTEEDYLSALNNTLNQIKLYHLQGFENYTFRDVALDYKLVIPENFKFEVPIDLTDEFISRELVLQFYFDYLKPDLDSFHIQLEEDKAKTFKGKTKTKSIPESDVIKLVNSFIDTTRKFEIEFNELKTILNDQAIKLDKIIKYLEIQ